MMPRAQTICRYFLLALWYWGTTTDKKNAGTYQSITHWRQRQHTDFERKASDRDMAGDMVFGVQERETKEESAGYDTGRKDVKGSGGILYYGTFYGRVMLRCENDFNCGQAR